MAEADIQYERGEGAFKLNSYVTVKVDKDNREVCGIITAAGTDEEGKPVPKSWNLTIPGWDTLHGPIDQDTKKPAGGHIYGVRPLAYSVPESDLKHASVPKILNVFSTGAKAHRINGDYELVKGGWGPENEEKRPMWKMQTADRTIVIVHKKQKGKPAWIITLEALIQESKDGGYALFAQDLWLPSHRDHHLRGEVWGIWDPEAGRWKADQSLFVTDGPGAKKELMEEYKKKMENAGK